MCWKKSALKFGPPGGGCAIAGTVLLAVSVIRYLYKVHGTRYTWRNGEGRKEETTPKVNGLCEITIPPENGDSSEIGYFQNFEIVSSPAAGAEFNHTNQFNIFYTSTTSGNTAAAACEYSILAEVCHFVKRLACTRGSPAQVRR